MRPPCTNPTRIQLAVRAAILTLACRRNSTSSVRHGCGISNCFWLQKTTTTTTNKINCFRGWGRGGGLAHESLTTPGVFLDLFCYYTCSCRFPTAVRSDPTPPANQLVFVDRLSAQVVCVSVWRLHNTLKCAVSLFTCFVCSDLATHRTIRRPQERLPRLSSWRGVHWIGERERERERREREKEREERE